ncbi:glycosyltransferase [Winogradskyella sp. 3972H.M.0a.05]|uniref:glycosyltransferase family 4 protein n=1 Tax=Winogradskyella sp. 3972H.M.0a.05 TaxID=2950277 RepID=UPI00339AF3BB
MKILHCINSPSVGGLERTTIELAIQQTKKGIDTSIMVDRVEGEYYDYLVENNVPLIISNIKGGFDFNPKTYNRLKKIFDDFDIVHQYNFSPIRAYASYRSKAAKVYTICGLSKGVRKENAIKYFTRETLKKWFLHKVDALVTKSRHLIEKSKEHYGLKHINISIVSNGSTLDKQLAELKKKSANEEFTIGLVSRFIPRKRVDRLLDGFKMFLDKGGKGQVLLVGDGPSMPDIKKQIEYLEIKDYIKLPGYQSEMAQFYEVFDIVVHPSDDEGTGNVAIESYLFGKPVIAFSDSGGFKEVLEPIEPENIVNTNEELSERLLFYYKNKDLIFDESQKRRNYAKENFSIESMEKNYRNIYNQIVNEKN